MFRFPILFIIIYIF